jgi:hypothetical protein
MSMSDVAIANRMLTWISSNQITDLNEDSDAARAVATVYPGCRDGLVGDYPWRFAMDRQLLPASATIPLFQWSYAYPIPPEWFRVWEVNGEWDPNDASVTYSGNYTDSSPGGFNPFNPIPWDVEGQSILSNTTGPLPCRGVKRITDPTQFPPVFIDALCAKLAKECVGRVTGSTAQVPGWDAEYKSYIARAKKANALEKPRMKQRDGQWTSARFRG